MHTEGFFQNKLGLSIFRNDYGKEKFCSKINHTFTFSHDSRNVEKQFASLFTMTSSLHNKS